MHDSFGGLGIRATKNIYFVSPIDLHLWSLCTRRSGCLTRDLLPSLKQLNVFKLGELNGTKWEKEKIWDHYISGTTETQVWGILTAPHKAERTHSCCKFWGWSTQQTEVFASSQDCEEESSNSGSSDEKLWPYVRHMALCGSSWCNIFPTEFKWTCCILQTAGTE